MAPPAGRRARSAPFQTGAETSGLIVMFSIIVFRMTSNMLIFGFRVSFHVRLASAPGRARRMAVAVSVAARTVPPGSIIRTRGDVLEVTTPRTAPATQLLAIPVSTNALTAPPARNKVLLAKGPATPAVPANTKMNPVNLHVKIAKPENTKI